MLMFAAIDGYRRRFLSCPRFSPAHMEVGVLCSHLPEISRVYWLSKGTAISGMNYVVPVDY